jgi:hypothetical protein
VGAGAGMLTLFVGSRFSSGYGGGARVLLIAAREQHLQHTSLVAASLNWLLISNLYGMTSSSSSSSSTSTSSSSSYLVTDFQPLRHDVIIIIIIIIPGY